FVDLTTVVPSAEARAVAARIGKDARVVELVLRESTAISREAPDVLVVRHRLGVGVAHAGLDPSHAGPPGGGGGRATPGAPAPGASWVLLLPEAPDRSAEALRRVLAAESGARIGVVVSDSFGRPFRVGSVGTAIGVAGLPAVWDQRGERDLFER